MLFWGDYIPQLGHFTPCLLFRAWELRNNMGISVQYSQFQFSTGKAHFCSTASFWAKFCFSLTQRLQRAQFAIILQWIMNPQGFHLQHVTHVTSQRRKSPFSAAQPGWTASAATPNPRAPASPSCMEPIHVEIVLITLSFYSWLQLSSLKRKFFLSLQFSTFPAWFWATPISIWH